jgi:hypothetical protein
MKMPSPVILEGGLYAGIALANFWQASLGSDTAAKMIGPRPLFWSQLFVGSAATVLLAIKMFRSTAFSDSQKNGKAPSSS